MGWRLRLRWRLKGRNWRTFSRASTRAFSPFPFSCKATEVHSGLGGRQVSEALEKKKQCHRDGQSQGGPSKGAPHIFSGRSLR